VGTGMTRKNNNSPLEGGACLAVALAEAEQGGVGWYYKLIVYKFLF